MSITAHRKEIVYFLWEEILAELKKQFSESELETFREKFLDEYVNEGGTDKLKGYNLYFFGPRPQDCENDPEEAERAKSVFGWTEDGEENHLLKKITHTIWNLIEVDDCENAMFQFP